MFKPFVTVGLAMIWSNMAVAQTNIVQTVTGSQPATVTINTLTSKCVNVGATTLLPNQAIPIPCNDAGQLSFALTQGGTTTDASSTITVGGTFQLIAAANPDRRSFEFTNVCAISNNCVTTGDICYIYFASANTPTLANSRPITPYANYLRSRGWIPTDAIYATCTGTGDKFQFSVQ